MPRIDDGTFFLYGAGLSPERVFLGHLVVGSYEAPIRAKHYSFPQLSEKDLSLWAEVRDWTGEIGVSKKGGFGVQGIFLGGGELGPEYSTEAENTIVAQKGRRIELKRPTEFFERMVLADQEARDNMEAWVTVTRSQYMAKAMGMVRPRIWMLTALLELEDAKLCAFQKKTSGIKARLDPAVLAGLCGAPVGFSFDLGRDVSVKVDSQSPGKLVWAAQYQRVATRYVVEDEHASPKLNWFRLPADSIYSAGVVLGDGLDGTTEEFEEFYISDDKESSVPDELTEKYWEVFERAEKRVREDKKIADGDFRP